jgi:valyl-tRNA synthetase
VAASAQPVSACLNTHLHCFAKILTLVCVCVCSEKMTSVASIMVSAYPKPVSEWTNERAEAAMEIVKDSIHGARSLRADYKIANNVKADFYFRIAASEQANASTSSSSSSSSSSSADQLHAHALTTQADDFCTLARGSFLRQLGEAEPAPTRYCCVKVLNNVVSLLVNLEGIVDIDQEIARLRKEGDKLRPMIDQYQRKITQTKDDAKVG